jgi:hypothetical protein
MGRFAGLIGFGLSIRRVGRSPEASGASVYRTQDSTATDFTSGVVVTFDAEICDIGGWHDTSTDPSRITIPPGVSYIQLIGQIQAANHTANELTRIRILKDGSVLALEVVVDDTLTGQPYQQIASYPIPVTAGNYFEMRYTVSGDTSTDLLAAGTWFSVRRVA